jgi:putative sterol carrier protein
MELGTPVWLEAARQAVNESSEYHERGAGWRWPLGLAFVGDDARPSRYARLDLQDGECRAAAACDEATYLAAPFRLSATYDRWQQLLERRLDPMRCILLRQVVLDGDRLTALRYLPAAKALLDAMATVAADVPGRT